MHVIANWSTVTRSHNNKYVHVNWSNEFKLLSTLIDDLNIISNINYAALN